MFGAKRFAANSAAVVAETVSAATLLALGRAFFAPYFERAVRAHSNGAVACRKVFAAMRANVPVEPRGGVYFNIKSRAFAVMPRNGIRHTVVIDCVQKHADWPHAAYNRRTERVHLAVGSILSVAKNFVSFGDMLAHFAAFARHHKVEYALAHFARFSYLSYNVVKLALNGVINLRNRHIAVFGRAALERGVRHIRKKIAAAAVNVQKHAVDNIFHAFARVDIILALY